MKTSLTELKFCQELSPASQVEEKIRKNLLAYNISKIGHYDAKAVCAYAQDNENVLVAGAYGWLKFGWLYIDLLWVAEDYRGQGIGTKLLYSMEQLAMQNACYAAYLNTGSFQKGLAFYQKNGYEIFASLPIIVENLPTIAGHINYFLKKILTAF